MKRREKHIAAIRKICRKRPLRSNLVSLSREIDPNFAFSVLREKCSENRTSYSVKHGIFNSKSSYSVFKSKRSIDSIGNSSDGRPLTLTLRNKSVDSNNERNRILNRKLMQDMIKHQIKEKLKKESSLLSHFVITHNFNQGRRLHNLESKEIESMSKVDLFPLKRQDKDKKRVFQEFSLERVPIKLRESDRMSRHNDPNSPNTKIKNTPRIKLPTYRNKYTKSKEKKVSYGLNCKSLAADPLNAQFSLNGWRPKTENMSDSTDIIHIY